MANSQILLVPSPGQKLSHVNYGKGEVLSVSQGPIGWCIRVKFECSHSPMTWNWDLASSEFFLEEALDPCEELLKEALKITSGARRQSYGKPEENFQGIADLWNAYLTHRDRCERDAELTPEDTAILMILVKVARIAESPDHRDSWVDLAGYAGCGWRCVKTASLK